MALCLRLLLPTILAVVLLGSLFAVSAAVARTMFYAD